MHQTLKNLLYYFIARDNPAKDSVPNRTFHAEFQQALKDDPEYQTNGTIDQFQFMYDFRNEKRAPGPSDSSRDSKRSKSSQQGRQTLRGLR